MPERSRKRAREIRNQAALPRNESSRQPLIDNSENLADHLDQGALLGVPRAAFQFGDRAVKDLVQNALW